MKYLEMLELKSTNYNLLAAASYYLEEGIWPISGEYWYAIGKALGISNDAARKRFRRIERKCEDNGVNIQAVLATIPPLDPTNDFVSTYIEELDEDLVITLEQHTQMRTLYTGNNIESNGITYATIANIVGLPADIVKLYIKAQGWEQDDIYIDELDAEADEDEVFDKLDELRTAKQVLRYKGKQQRAFEQKADLLDKMYQGLFNPIADLMGRELVDESSRSFNYVKEEEDKVLAYITVFNDLHYGKTADDYSLKVAEKRLNLASARLVEHCIRMGASELLITFGGDTLNFDGIQAKTTKGTQVTSVKNPRIVAEEFVSCVFKAVKSFADLVKEENTIEKVTFVLTPGNHDDWTSRIIFNGMAAAMEDIAGVHFLNKKGVVRYYYPFGRSLLMLGHGITEKINRIASLVMSECPKNVRADRDLIYALLQHLHIRTVENQHTIYLHRSPALSGNDDWHRNNTFVGRPGAEVIFFNTKEGRVGNNEVWFDNNLEVW